MSLDVLVVGALHHDVIVRAPRLPALDETLPGAGVSYAFGGKGGNQAVAAARHGARVAMAGRVGADAAGRDLLAALDAAGVDRARVRVDPRAASGMSVAIVTASGDYGAVIVSGANLAVDGAEAPEGARVVLLQNEIPEGANRAAAARARAAGALVVHNAAPARPPDAELLAATGLLVANRVEAAALTGADDPQAAARALADGRRDAVVTLGAEGCLLATRAGALLRVPAHAVPVVSTHGAGDAFVGALAARLAAGDALEPAVRYAGAAAALHVSRDEPGRAAIGPEATRALTDRA